MITHVPARGCRESINLGQFLKVFEETADGSLVKTVSVRWHVKAVANTVDRIPFD